MKSICLLTCLLMHIGMTSADNKDRYKTGAQEYPDVFLLLDENDVFDKMLDQAWLEVNGSAEEERPGETGGIEASGKSAASSGIISEQSGEEELGDQTGASGETASGSGKHEVSGDNIQRHHQGVGKRPVQQMDTGCGCEGETCECCLDVDITHNSAEVCVKVTLLREELGLKFAITWKGQTAFSKIITAKNPPSICFSIPFVRFLKGCVRFSEISYDHHKFGGCIWLGLKLVSLKKEFKLGCFYTPSAKSLVPKQGKHQVQTTPRSRHPIRRPREKIAKHSPIYKAINRNSNHLRRRLSSGTRWSDREKGDSIRTF